MMILKIDVLGTKYTIAEKAIDEDDYFCHVTHKTWDAILHALRTAHANDTESAPDVSNASSVIK